MTPMEQSWRAMCEQLQAFGQEALRAEHPIDRVEGLRHALRFLGHMTDNTIEHADPLRPQFRRICSPTRKFYGDCVDVDYFQAPIDPSRAYRIVGRRGTAPHVSILVYRSGAADRIAGNLVDHEFGVRDDGSFELWLGPDPGPGPGILLDARCFEVVLRQYHKDRSVEQDGVFEIQLVGPDPGPRPELRDDVLVRALSTCTRALEVAPRRLEALRARLLERPNVLVDSTRVGLTETFFGTASNKYLVGWFRLASGEAIEFDLPRVAAAYVGVQIFNRWFESLEYRDRVTSLNDRQLAYGDDDRARVTIGGPPGAPNRIDPCGHGEGVMIIRFLETDNALPDVACRHLRA
jgi:hypothetical protein